MTPNNSILIFNYRLVVEKFRSWLQEDHNLAEAMAGVKALTEVVRSSKGTEHIRVV